MADPKVGASIEYGKARPVRVYVAGRRDPVLKLSLRQAAELRTALDRLGRFVDTDPEES